MGLFRQEPMYRAHCERIAAISKAGPTQVDEVCLMASLVQNTNYARNRLLALVHMQKVTELGLHNGIDM